MSETSKSNMPLIRVLWLIRDARSTRGAARELLYALALRCKPAKAFVCWPSYEQLALDTGLHMMTLKRAAQRLEADGYISRSSRSGHSNKFYLNIPKIEAEAETVREKDKVAKEAARAAMVDESPFGQPAYTAASTKDVNDDDNYEVAYD